FSLPVVPDEARRSEIHAVAVRPLPPGRGGNGKATAWILRLAENDKGEEALPGREPSHAGAHLVPHALVDLARGGVDLLEEDAVRQQPVRRRKPEVGEKVRADEIERLAVCVAVAIGLDQRRAR